MASEIVDGKRTSFGPRTVEQQAPYAVGDGVTKEMVVPLVWDDLKTGADADDDTVQVLPAYSWIKSATLEVIEPFTSGGLTTLDIGLIEPDGTVIDLNGIDEVIAKAAMDAKGERVLCDGALVGNTAGIGAADAQVYFTVTTGPYTAGKARLIIDYVPLGE